MPSPALVAEGYLPLHRTPTHIVGPSIAELLPGSHQVVRLLDSELEGFGTSVVWAEVFPFICQEPCLRASVR